MLQIKSLTYVYVYRWVAVACAVSLYAAFLDGLGDFLAPLHRIGGVRAGIAVDYVIG